MVPNITLATRSVMARSRDDLADRHAVAVDFSAEACAALSRLLRAAEDGAPRRGFVARRLLAICTDSIKEDSMLEWGSQPPRLVSRIIAGTQPSRNGAFPLGPGWTLWPGGR